MVRPHGRSARIAVSLAVLVVAVVHAPVTPRASAQQNPRAAAFARVQQINQQRGALETQLEQLKKQLPSRRSAVHSRRLRSEAPSYSLGRAPQERAKLLDEAAVAARALADVSGKLAEKESEDLALELELGDIVAAAQRDAALAQHDFSKRADQIAKRAREHVAALRERAQVTGPRALEGERARVEERVSRYRMQQQDAEQLAARFEGELRYAAVEPTLGTTFAGARKSGAPLSACKARQVDWNNVTITVAGQTMTLRDGRGAIEPPTRGSGTRVTVKQVDILDSNVDVREEALILVEREERGASAPRRSVTSDVLYVFESALDCSLRRRAQVVLGSGGGRGEAVRGGYDYTARTGAVQPYRWENGLLQQRAASSSEHAAR